MEIADARIFLGIARQGNISMAAHMLFLTQSTVSRRLSLLEQELGVRLVERGRGLDHVYLTPAGERFVPIAEQLVALEGQARLLQNDGIVRQMSMAVPDSIASYMLGDFFRGITGKRPEWNLRLTMQDSLPICEMVVSGAVDIGITNGEYSFSELNTWELFREDFVVLTRSPKLGARRQIHPRELDVRDEVCEKCGAEFDRWHSYWWREEQARMTVNLAQFAVEMLRPERDWTILPRSVARALCPPDGFLVELSEPAPERVCQFVTHRAQRAEMAQISREMYDEMREFLTRRGILPG